jgi:hypothetical protein
MKKALVLTVFLALATLIVFGCAKSDNSQLMVKPVKARAFDADKNGLIEEKDVFILYDRADAVYDGKIQPYLTKAGVENTAEIYTQEANFRLRSKLTVIEWEEFTRNLEEWNKINAQIEATAEEAMNKVVEQENPVSRSGKVAACHAWGPIEFVDGTVIKYAGIQIPVDIRNNKYCRTVALFSSKLINGRLIRYNLTGKKNGNVNEAYIYINDVCINEELVKRGYALAIRDQSEMAPKLIELEEKAKENKRGLWAFHPQEKPFADPLY